MNDIMTSLLQSHVMEWALGLPEWAIIAFLAACVAAFVLLFLFREQVTKYGAKVGITADQVEPVVKTLAMFAIQLFVMKQGLQETRRISQLRTITQLIDTMYDSKSTLRVSELVRAMDEALVRNAVVFDIDAQERVELVKDMAGRIVKEVQTVGNKVNDNENDPIVRPTDVAAWINNTINTIHKTKEKQARF